MRSILLYENSVVLWLTSPTAEHQTYNCYSCKYSLMNDERSVLVANIICHQGLISDSLFVWRFSSICSHLSISLRLYVPIVMTLANFCEHNYRSLCFYLTHCHVPGLAVAATLVPLWLYHDVDCALKVRVLSAQLMVAWGWSMLVMHTVLSVCIFIRVMYTTRYEYFRSRIDGKPLVYAARIIERAARNSNRGYRLTYKSFVPLWSLAPSLGLGSLLTI